MKNSPYIVIKKLILKGVDRDYKASFCEGLNVIWGDMDSGKSSILNIIDYCLGGKNEKLLYDEISEKARMAYLEADLNGTINTFIRNIADQAAPVQVYLCGIDEISDNFPMLMSAHPSKMMPDGWLSDHILDCLGIAKVRIKESRHRDDSDSDRLSFRDLMKLMYLRQTKVGADSLLDYGNFAVFNKNIQIQKFIYNIHDDSISILSQELQRESKELNTLQNSEASIKGFLSSIKISTDDAESLSTKIEEKEDALNQLNQQVFDLKKDHKLSSELSVSISKQIFKLRTELDELSKSKAETKIKLHDFTLLKNTYASDLQSINISKITRKALCNQKVLKNQIPCPLCDQSVEISAPAISADTIELEIRSIKNRHAGVQLAITKHQQELSKISARETQVTDLLNELSYRLELDNKEAILPIVANIQIIDQKIAETKIELSDLKRSAAIINKFGEILAKINLKISTIRKIKDSITEAESRLTGLPDVIESLSSLLKSYFNNSGLQRVFGVFIGNNFVPHIRDMSYYDASSGGVRTITSIAWFVTRLEYLLKNKSNLPTFIMIDTPGQNIGRYSRDDESDFSDPALYEKIYQQILTLLSKYPDKKCQIIVVDNDLPRSLKPSDYHLVKRFSKKGGEHEKGLIADY